MYYVYLLRSKKKDHWHYIGYTADLRKRFKEHQNGLSESTKLEKKL